MDKFEEFVREAAVEIFEEEKNRDTVRTALEDALKKAEGDSFNEITQFAEALKKHPTAENKIEVMRKPKNFEPEDFVDFRSPVSLKHDRVHLFIYSDSRSESDDMWPLTSHIANFEVNSDGEVKAYWDERRTQRIYGADLKEILRNIFTYAKEHALINIRPGIERQIKDFKKTPEGPG